MSEIGGTDEHITLSEVMRLRETCRTGDATYDGRRVLSVGITMQNYTDGRAGRTFAHVWLVGDAGAGVIERTMEVVDERGATGAHLYVSEEGE
jgi:hypothetical protein